MDLQPNKTDGIYLPITINRISASEWNQLVGSCMAFITEAGLTPDAADNEQFLNAFKAIAADLALVGANTNLSNLTAEGQSKFDEKADIVNAYMRQYTPLNIIVATGNTGIAGTYTLSDLPDDNKIRIAFFEVSIQLSSAVAEYSAMSLFTDVFTTGTTVVGTNNGFEITTTICMPVKRQITIGFPHISGGVDGSLVRLLGYY